jgi:dTDP-glucose 4,6-dehydratase
VDSTHLTQVTGWRPQIPFEEGIRQTVNWYKVNEAWWRPIKEGEFRAYYERMYGQRRGFKEVRA